MLAQAMAIKQHGFLLVAKTHQTFVARRQTARFQVVSGGVKMTPLQRLDGQSRDGIRLLDETRQRTHPAFARFIKQQGTLFAFTNALGTKFGFFQLEQLFHAALEGVLQRGFQTRVATQFRAEQTHEQQILRGLDG